MNSNLLFDFSVNKENKTVHIVREFDADIDNVWEAWTTAELLDKWWAPKPYTSKTKIMNFEVGGRRFYAMVGAEGQELSWSIQRFTSINRKTNFKMSSNFADKDENPEVPGSEWDMSFKEENGKTKVSITITNESRERMERMIEMGFKEGFTMGLEQLDELLAASTNR
jgi:uncharacterized protein YndB with AHSA1/START domain